MDYNRICIHCMHEKENIYDVCPECGFDPARYEVKRFVLMPGTILHRRYFVGVSIGRGGFGITYAAYDTIFERKVAIKEFFYSDVMYRDNPSNPFMTVAAGTPEKERMYYFIRGRFEQEARILSKLDNLPGIVRISDFFMENGTSYMVEEFLDGINMKEYVRANGPFRDSVLLEKMQPILESLQIIHKQGIIHRDIAPDNIMVLKDGSMKLYDFGTAHESGESEKSQIIQMKPGYSPIEQYVSGGDDQGPWTDIYALSATMYYALTGITPPEPTKRSSGGGADDPLKPVSKTGVSVMPNVEKALIIGMSVPIRDRFQSVPEMMDVLYKQSPPPSPMPIFPWVIGAGVVLAVIAAVIIINILLNQSGPSVHIIESTENTTDTTMTTEQMPETMTKSTTIVAVDSTRTTAAAVTTTEPTTTMTTESMSTTTTMMTTEPTSTTTTATTTEPTSTTTTTTTTEPPTTTTTESTSTTTTTTTTEPTTTTTTESTSTTTTTTTTEPTTTTTTELTSTTTTTTTTEPTTTTTTESTSTTMTTTTTEPTTTTTTESTSTTTTTTTTTTEKPKTPAYGEVGNPKDGGKVRSGNKLGVKGWVLLKEPVSEPVIYVAIDSEENKYQISGIDELSQKSFEKYQKENAGIIAAAQGWSFKDNITVEISTGSHTLIFMVEDPGTGKIYTFAQNQVTAQEGKKVPESSADGNSAEGTGGRFINENTSSKTAALGLDEIAEGKTVSPDQILVSGWINADENEPSPMLILYIDQTAYSADNIRDMGGSISMNRYPRSLSDIEGDTGGSPRDLMNAGMIIDMSLPFLSPGSHTLGIQFSVDGPMTPILAEYSIVADPAVPVDQNAEKRIEDTWLSGHPELQKKTEDESESEKTPD